MDFYERISVAKDLGFDAVEFYNPADYNAKRIAGTLSENGLSVAIMGMYNGYVNRLTDDYDVLLSNLKKSAEFGKAVGCMTFTCHAPENVHDTKVETERLISNLSRMADYLERNDITLAIENLNSKYEAKGYLLDTIPKIASIISKVGSSKIRILNDLYHTQIMEGDLIRTISKTIGVTAHFHAASVPDRNELFNGELNYPFIINAIDAAGYTGYFGLEYYPSYDHRQSYKDVRAYLDGNQYAKRNA